jgi:hypothetical protein
VLFWSLDHPQGLLSMSDQLGHYMMPAREGKNTSQTLLSFIQGAYVSYVDNIKSFVFF